MSTVLNRRLLARYAMLGVPLGCVGLPLYVHLPKFYSDYLPVSLTLLGVLLFATRILDCLLDPIIGAWSDRVVYRRKLIMALSVPVLALGVLSLFYLPMVATQHNAPWLLGIIMSISYIAYSILMINFYANGLSLSQKPADTTRISAWREGAIILGVIFASILPQVLMQQIPVPEAYHMFAWVFAGLLAVIATAHLTRNTSIDLVVNQAEDTSSDWKDALKVRDLRWIFSIFLFNAIAPSITATLFLFFVEDVLKAADHSGAFLLVYFLGALLSMPLWTRLSERMGKKRAQLLAMILAIASFIWAYALGAGDEAAFYAICMLSGIALGGDLTLLPSILADAISHKKHIGGFAFGIWNFISKFTLACAAGIALPMLSYLGYDPHAQVVSNTHALSISYALLPCAFKLIACSILFISPIHNQRRIS